MVVDNGRMVARRKFGQKKRKYRAKYRKNRAKKTEEKHRKEGVYVEVDEQHLRHLLQHLLLVIQ